MMVAFLANDTDYAGIGILASIRNGLLLYFPIVHHTNVQMCDANDLLVPSEHLFSLVLVMRFVKGDN